MWSFFRRAPRLRPAPPLLSEINALDQEKRDSTARQLAWLWSSFTEEFGISRFIEAPSSDQQAYLARLDRIVERGRELKDTDLARYYYSAALLRDFLEAHRTHDTSPAAKAIAERFVGLTERGRELEQNADQGPDLTYPARRGPPDRKLVELGRR